jgi:acyl-CoA thioesterase-1
MSLVFHLVLLGPLLIACGPGSDAEDGAAGQTRAGAGVAGSARATASSRAASALTPDTTRVILFLGTSLTAGYGVGQEAAYPARIQEKIDSAGLPWRVENAGASGDVSASGLRRLDWRLRTRIDALVLELGANDGLRGLDTGALRANLDSILTRTRRAYPDAKLVVLGMEAPPNMGIAYTREFQQVFPVIAAKHDAALVPFLLDDVAAIPHMNQQDGIHPTARGHEILARNVWEILGPLLRENGGS